MNPRTCGILAVVAVLVGCAGRPAVAPSVSAPSAASSSSSALPDSGWHIVTSPRFFVSLPLPDAAAWHVDDRSGRWLVATHVPLDIHVVGPRLARRVRREPPPMRDRSAAHAPGPVWSRRIRARRPKAASVTGGLRYGGWLLRPACQGRAWWCGRRDRREHSAMPRHGLHVTRARRSRRSSRHCPTPSRSSPSACSSARKRTPSKIAWAQAS